MVDEDEVLYLLHLINGSMLVDVTKIVEANSMVDTVGLGLRFEAECTFSLPQDRGRGTTFGGG